MIHAALSSQLETNCKNLLIELGITTPGEPIDVHPLTGGVASDIAMVTAGQTQLCAKFALPKLKVAANWFAPVKRNAAEYAWLEFAARVAPEGAIKLYGHSEQLHGFAMEFLDGNNIYLWKSRLLAQATDGDEAENVGKLLGRIHAASAAPAFNRQPFLNREDFHALRIEPYLLYTASKHPDISTQLENTASTIYNGQQVLVHGDISPKNIIIRERNPILLDAECATMGDASFDPAFCMNHLVLKALHLPDSKENYLASAKTLWSSYRPFIDWESSVDLESRICKLLPALMLARVDGKSPVEYLTKTQQERVRRIATHFILSPVSRLDKLIQGIDQLSKEMGA